jgi:predicted nucleic acid-binding protein
MPLQALADHVPTQPAYNQSIALDTTTGDLTIGIYTSDGFEDSPPEKYTIWFTISDTDIDTSTAYCISTSFGHTDNLVWNYHVFSLEDLQTYFENPYGTFRTQIRSDNDTDSSYSTLTLEQTITIPNELPFINLGEWTAPTNTCTDTSTTTTTTTVAPPPTPNNAINVSVNYQGQDVFFEWEYADGDVDAHSFHINYSYDNTNFTRVIIDDTTLREYTLGFEYIETGTFYWSFSVCGDLDNGESCTESDANNFETTEYTPPKTTTTTTLPPAPPPPPPEPEPEPIEIVMDDGTVAEYTESEVEDGTVERDNERAKNEELYGVALTDEQVARGDLDNYDIEIIEIEEEDMGEIGEEFFDDVDIPEFVEDEPIEEEYIELTEEEVEELEREMERDVKKLEYEEEIEILEFESEEEMDEYIDTIIEVEEYLEDLEEFEFVIIEDFEEIEIDMVEFYIETDLFPPSDEDIQEDLEEVQDKIIKEDKEEDIDDWDTEYEEVEDENYIEVLPPKDIAEEVEEILTEEMVEEEVAELEQVIEEIIVIDIPEVTEKELEEFTEEELEEYEDAKEEAIEVYVQELDTEEVVEVLEEVNDIGVQNLEQATEEVQEVVQAVVEEAIDDIEILTEEQVEVVAEVLQVQTEDVEIIAEAIQEDEVVAEAVEEYVERAVENADVENYTLADVVTEVQFETFLENQIETFVDVDFTEISIENIGDDMTNDQKEKAQEVVVPVILTRIASMAAFMFRRGNV